MKDWNQGNKMKRYRYMNNIQDEKQNQDRALEPVEIKGTVL